MSQWHTCMIRQVKILGLQPCDNNIKGSHVGGQCNKSLLYNLCENDV